MISLKRSYIVLALCLTLSILAACNRPAGKSPNALPSVEITKAVQTLAANLTVTPGPSATRQVLPSATQVKPTKETATDTPVSPTQTTSPASTATTAPTPAVTLNPADPLAGLGNPDWHEGFNGAGSWYTYQDEFISFQSKDVKLEMTAFQANNRNGWALAPQLVSNRFYVELTATFGNACKGADHFGLMLSPVSSADRGYLFGISCDGKYILWKWDGTRMTALVKWTASKDIQAGADKTNRIGIKGEGDKLSLYANGVLLTELTDKTYDRLYFGVFIGASETANFLVRVSNLNYWSLPK